MTEIKRKQKPKRGKVVRLVPELEQLVIQEKGEGETYSDVLLRLLGGEGEEAFVLPSDIYKSAAEARGTALVRAHHAKSKRAERPLPVMVKK